MVNSLPQTGLKEFQRLVIDLKEPKPQTVTQTFQDETGLGTRTTTWTFTLIPRFSIERDDRAADGRYSFVSTDSISLHMAIAGMTVAKSGWANQASWEAKGTGPFSGAESPIRYRTAQRSVSSPIQGAVLPAGRRFATGQSSTPSQRRQRAAWSTSS